MDNLPDDLRSRASQLFDCVIGYAVDLLMWQDCLTLPEDVKLDHISDVYVTMLFNDEVHTYEQVGSLTSRLSPVTTPLCSSTS